MIIIFCVSDIYAWLLPVEWFYCQWPIGCWSGRNVYCQLYTYSLDWCFIAPFPFIFVSLPFCWFLNIFYLSLTVAWIRTDRNKWKHVSISLSRKSLPFSSSSSSSVELKKLNPCFFWFVVHVLFGSQTGERNNGTTKRMRNETISHWR